MKRKRYWRLIKAVKRSDNKRYILEYFAKCSNRFSIASKVEFNGLKNVFFILF